MTISLNRAKVKRNILVIALIIAAVTIPLHNNLNSWALIFLFFAGLIQNPFSHMKNKLLQSKFWLLPVCYFLWLACSYIWDVSGGFTIKELEGYATFFFIPIILAAVPRISPKDIRNTCMAFIIVTTIVSIICLVKSYMEYQVTGDYRVFYYHYLSQQVGLNAIFLSNYCLASITWILYYSFIQKNTIPKAVKLLIIIIGCFQFFMIFLLSSKMSIFLLGLFLLVLILYIGIAKKYLLRSLLIVSIIGFACFFAVRNLSYVQWRFNVTELKKYSGKEDDNNGLAVRLVMWESAIELIKEKPLLGYGIKGVRQEMVQKYQEKNFQIGIREGYNSHNQYLETTLMTGVIGLLLFLLILSYAGVVGIREKNVLLLIILLHFMLKSMLEATLEVQQELVFFLFFIFLFYYHPPTLDRADKITS